MKNNLEIALEHHGVHLQTWLSKKTEVTEEDEILQFAAALLAQDFDKLLRIVNNEVETEG